MEKSAVESIFGMLDAGCINKEQAIRLLSDDNKKIVVRDHRNEDIEKIVNILMYGDGEVRGFRLNEIFTFMKSVDWIWYGESVDETGFKHILTGLVRDCLKEVVDNKKEEWSISTAGLRVCCYREDNDDEPENPYVVTELEFIADNSLHYSKLNDFLL